MKIAFRPLAAEDLPLLRSWLREPHVAEYWQEPEDEEEFREKFLKSLPRRGVSAFVIEVDGRAIGYIQEYEAVKVGGGWWPDVRPGVFGIDQFIGDANYISKGIGTLVIGEFVRRMFARAEVKEIITDPDPANHRAIRAYEKVGFRRVQEIVTPGGAALLMRLESGASLN